MADKSAKDELACLQETIVSLREQLEEKQHAASLSAECGLKLMEMNQDLEQRLEETTKDFTKQIEVKNLCRNKLYIVYTCMYSTVVSRGARRFANSSGPAWLYACTCIYLHVHVHLICHHRN